MTRKSVFIAAVAAALAVPSIAQIATPTPTRAIAVAPDLSKVTAGTYAVDTHHTQVGWDVSHLGFNDYYGIFGGATGRLMIDPADPTGASVSIDIPIAAVATTRQALTDHLMKADFFDVANHPVATFRSTAVTVDGTRAKIAGNLTLRGVTKPIVLDARIVGAGANPVNKKSTIGFEATAVVKRSDFGIMYGLPAIGEMVELRISAAFEKVA